MNHDNITFIPHSVFDVVDNCACHLQAILEWPVDYHIIGCNMYPRVCVK